MMSICWLGDTDCINPSIVGGKAANLGRLFGKFPIPPGFCVTELVDPLITDAYRHLAKMVGDEQPAVAVRSSGVSEDSIKHSFAGQHDTYLNIRGMQELIDAVRRCWKSAETEHANSYRKAHGLDPESTDIAVLVQQLVLADISAVVFTANPITKDPDEIVINANWGLGESLVSGAISADQFIVSKSDLTIKSSQLSTKEQMTILAPSGTVRVTVPRLMRSRSSLDQGQIQTLARLACDVETSVNYPIDLECAFSANQVYLLQVRPITTL
jgi:pyruvate,water dikinase